MNKFLIIGIFFFFVKTSVAQSILEKYNQMDFKNLGIQEGLSQGNVRTLLQDSKGFIWAGTEDGLNRYNGYEFENFYHIDGDEKSLSSSFIRDIAEDKNGVIWIATRDGLNSFHRESNSFTTYFKDQENSNSISDNNITALFVDSKNRLWIGTSMGGLNLFNTETETFISFQYDAEDPSSLPNNRVNNIFEDSKNNIWVGTNGGLSLYNPHESNFKSFTHDDDNPNSISNNIVMQTYEDSFHNLWVCTFQGGLNYFDFEQETFTDFQHKPDDPGSISHNETTSIIEAEKGILMLATGFGLNVFHISGKPSPDEKFIRVLKNSSLKTSLKSNILLKLIKDQYDQIWIGNRYQGIDIYKVGERIFEHYQGENPEGLNHNNVSSFAEDKSGNIWIGTDGGGLNYFDPKTKAFSYLRNDPEDKNSLSSDKVLTVEIDQSGNLWVGTWNKGINYLNTKTKKFTHFLHNPKDKHSLSGNHILEIFNDSKDNIWVGTWINGLNKFNKKQNNFTRYPYGKDSNKSLLGITIFDIEESQEGKIWVGTEESGLSLFDQKNETFLNLQASNSDLKQLSYRSIHCIYIDKKGFTWVGTDGNGLKVLNPETKAISHLTKKEGLPNNTVFGILEDNEGGLWISTNAGISNLIYNHTSGEYHFKNYDVDDGLQSNQFNRWSYFKASNGDLYFGGVNGFNIIHPGKTLENKIVPPVYITNFNLFNKTVAIGESDSPLQKHISATEEITLKPGETFFSFEFVALNFYNSQKNQYAYKMEGYDHEWVNIGYKREATFTNLDPGTYTFRVKASNNDGLWNDKGASVKIKILPYWYETLWFKILIASTLILLIVVWYNRRVKKLKSQKLILEHRVNERTRALSQANKELHEKHEEVQLQSEELQTQNEELNTQREELHTQYEKLAETYEKLKNTQAQLIQSEKMASLGILTAGIAHEINNPVNFIQAGIVGMEKAIQKLLKLMDAYDTISEENLHEKLREIEIIKEEIKFDQLVKLLAKVTNDIGIGVNRTAEIVKELRTFARVDSPNLKRADIHEGINSSLFLLQNKYKGRIEIIKDYGNLPLITCYPGKLNQVFMNLLVNAVQAIENEGKINIITLNENGGIYITIKDSGKGMSDEIRRQMFEPFFSTKDEGQGTGMGLAISLGIIEEHKGSISVESSPGQGTSITVTLPLNFSKV